ncbi:MAG TPA: c-type cytochrome [Mycobacteriales bacterium]|nr:c-type cytochrome [Mycobacteriales bacterium]
MGIASTVAGRVARRRRQFASVAFVAVALGTVGTVYAAVAPRGEAATSADPAVERGADLYRRGCSSCHGLNGEGGQRAPSLIGVGAASVDFQVGTGRMPLREHGAQAERKRSSYDEQQILDMAAYIASLGPGPAIPQFSPQDWQKADTAYGGALFRTNCAQCHNFAGSGGALTYGKFAPTLSDATPTQIYEAMITGPENMPVFGDKQITPDQKLAIINYIRTLKTEANPGGFSLGRIGPVPETMVGWLVGIGLLVIVTLWIGAKE